jgi:phage baseplate assembly protein W
VRQPDIPQFAFPLRFQGGRPVVVEQGSIDEIRDNVEVIVRTPLGARVEYPDFGVTDPTFRQGVDLDEIREACDEAEPRAVTLLDSELDAEQMVRQINIGVGVAEDG